MAGQKEPSLYEQCADLFNRSRVRSYRDFATGSGFRDQVTAFLGRVAGKPSLTRNVHREPGGSNFQIELPDGRVITVNESPNFRSGHPVLGGTEQEVRDFLSQYRKD